ncbi:MAG: CvpA family protein [Candidatus Paracaedimonas acanthamoebae]|uniref:CvpA family protein n=1 Tax=Candidatus Paracaedimonas acanthamoebae TaxID=244581 RepID=A0A8J7TVI2_9PROT|nr:CvpA family protein [Candidatus Paracaedimonas acanthamoebae]
MIESSFIISEFNAIDMGILSILALSALIGILRGFTREFFGIAGWAGAFFVTIWGVPFLQPLVYKWVGNSLLADIIAALGLFIFSFVTFMTLIRALSNRVKGSILVSLDRSLGLLFGILRGSVIAIFLFFMSNFLWKPDHRPLCLLSAKSYPFLLKSAETILLFFPKGLVSIEFFKSKIEASSTFLQNPEKLMEALSQPKPKENEKNKADGYRTQHRHSMDRLIQNYKTDEEA